MAQRRRGLEGKAVAKRPPFPRSHLILEPHGKWEVDQFVPVAKMMSCQPGGTEAGAILMARFAVLSAYEEGWQAAKDARTWVEQRERLLELRSAPARLALALRDLDPRCLAPERQRDVYRLLECLAADPPPSAAELRDALT